MKFLLILLNIFFLSSIASASLQIYPTRLQLSPRNKTATLSIKLKGDKPETFRISTMFYEMLPDGSMKQRPDLTRGEESASPYIRFSPKRITLQPNVEQIIRISTRKLKKISRKEVRTHLYFRPEEKNNVQEIEIPGDKNQSAFKLKAQVAVAIPIIVSTEPNDKPHTLENFKVYNEKGINYFSVDLINSSDRYLYGDFKVTHEKDGKKQVIAAANGVSSYIPKRLVKYPFIKDKKAPLAGGKYTLEFLEYSGTKKDNGKVTKVEFKK